MNKKVTQIPIKLHYKKFAKKYPRYERQNNSFIEVTSHNDRLLYVPPPPDEFVYVETKDEPSEGYNLILEKNVEDILPHFNSLLVFRVFSLLYESEPDFLTAYASLSKEALFPLDWSYTFSLQNNILGELRSRQQNIRLYICFWSSNLQGDKIKARTENSIQKCIDDFIEIIEKNLHLFDEKHDLTKTVSINHEPYALVNVSAEKYKGAELILSIARAFDKRPSRILYQYNERLPLRSVGYIYLSASILFFVSLESFINTLYYLLLKDEFRGDLYKRFTIKSDLDLRILSIHLFCKGFKEQPVRPGSDLWEKLITLRNFRNDVMHGNLTDDHHMHIIREQPYPFNFYYMPATDFRGRQKEKKHRTDFTRFQPDIDEEMVQSIQQTVDDVFSAIISSMYATTKKWVKGWLREPFILRQ